MAMHPVLHEAFDTIRFGRALFVELAPGDSPTAPCRYCRLLAPGARPSSRGHFSNPESAARAVLDTLGSGEPPDMIVFGGPGDPLREKNIGTILRRIRQSAHLGSVLLTDGALLFDREIRRESAEAESVVVTLPALHHPRDADRSVEALARKVRFDHLLANLAALRRETQVHLIVEIGVKPGETDDPRSIQAWKEAIDFVRPQRTHVIPLGPDASPETMAALDRVREVMPRSAGVSLVDPTPIDRRCWCDPESGWGSPPAPTEATSG